MTVFINRLKLSAQAKFILAGFGVFSFGQIIGYFRAGNILVVKSFAIRNTRQKLNLSFDSFLNKIAAFQNHLLLEVLLIPLR